MGLYEFERIDAEVKTPYTYYGGMKAHRSLVHEGSFDEVLYILKNGTGEGFSVERSQGIPHFAIIRV